MFIDEFNIHKVELYKDRTTIDTINGSIQYTKLFS